MEVGLTNFLNVTTEIAEQQWYFFTKRSVGADHGNNNNTEWFCIYWITLGNNPNYNNLITIRF